MYFSLVSLLALATLTSAIPYHGQYNFTGSPSSNARNDTTHGTGLPCATGSAYKTGCGSASMPTDTGVAKPTGTGSPVSTTSVMPFVSGAGSRSSSPGSGMLGLVLAMGGVVVLV